MVIAVVNVLVGERSERRVRMDQIVFRGNLTFGLNNDSEVMALPRIELAVILTFTELDV